MTYKITGELSSLRWWCDQQPPGPVVDATVNGFLWMLSIASGVSARVLREQLDAPSQVAPAPAAPPPSPVPVETPGWQGLGIPRIEGRQREVTADEPVAAPRAWTTGPDGRPIRAEASYAELAGRGPLVDTEGTEPATGV